MSNDSAEDVAKASSSLLDSSNGEKLETVDVDYLRIDKPSVELEVVADAGSSDHCSICLAPRTDETRLSGCSHSFCYSCIYEWLKISPSCPMCKAEVQFTLTTRDGVETKRMMQELKREMEEARISAAAREEPLISERQAVLAAYRSRRRTFNRFTQVFDGSHMFPGYDEQRRLMVEDISAVRSLRDDMASMTRGQLMSDSRFRRLIYSERLRWSPLTRSTLTGNFSPAMATAEADRVRSRICPWILRDLPIVTRFALSERRRNELVNSVFHCILNYQINSPNFQTVLCNMRVFNPDYIDQFCELLFEFCASNLSMAAHDDNSSFSLRQNLLTTNDESGNGSLEVTEIVVESEDDDIRELPAYTAEASHSSSSDDAGGIYTEACRIRQRERRRGREREGGTSFNALRGSQPVSTLSSTLASLLPLIRSPTRNIFTSFHSRVLSPSNRGEDDAGRREATGAPVVTLSDDDGVEGFSQAGNLNGRPSRENGRTTAPWMSSLPSLSPRWLPIQPGPSASQPSTSSRVAMDFPQLNAIRDPPLDSRKNTLKYHHERLTSTRVNTKEFMRRVDELKDFSRRVQDLCNEMEVEARRRNRKRRHESAEKTDEGESSRQNEREHRNGQSSELPPPIQLDSPGTASNTTVIVD